MNERCQKGGAFTTTSGQHNYNVWHCGNPQHLTVYSCLVTLYCTTHTARNGGGGVKLQPSKEISDHLPWTAGAHTHTHTHTHRVQNTEYRIIQSQWWDEMVTMTDTVSQGKTYTQYPQNHMQHPWKGVQLPHERYQSWLQFGYLPQRWDKWTIRLHTWSDILLGHIHMWCTCTCTCICTYTIVISIVCRLTTE